MKDVFGWLVAESIPNDDREFAESTANELLNGISPDVLYTRHEDGTVDMDKDYTAACLLLWRNEFESAQTPAQQQRLLIGMRKMLMPQSAPIGLLRGEYGQERQREFLDGALYGVELMMDAELVERAVTATPTSPRSKFRSATTSGCQA